MIPLGYITLGQKEVDFLTSVFKKKVKYFFKSAIYSKNLIDSGWIQAEGMC